MNPVGIGDEVMRRRYTWGEVAQPAGVHAHSVGGPPKTGGYGCRKRPSGSDHDEQLNQRRPSSLPKPKRAASPSGRCSRRQSAKHRRLLLCIPGLPCASYTYSIPSGLRCHTVLPQPRSVSPARARDDAPLPRRRPGQARAHFSSGASASRGRAPQRKHRLTARPSGAGTPSATPRWTGQTHG